MIKKNQTILTKDQKTFLDFISQQPSITKRFYLTGGTALAGFYLRHRYSEDLDFFSEELVDPLEVETFLKDARRALKFKPQIVRQTYNRNVYELQYPSGRILKVEFNYYPFPRIEAAKKFGKLSVDSVYDIAVNKAHTILQHPRARDYVDIYFIIRQYQYPFNQLVKDSRNKFDWQVDSVQLARNLQKIDTVADWPRMVKPLNKTKLKQFFHDLAMSLEDKILK